MIGRDAELAVVDAFLGGFGSGMQVLAIQGEPGIGKTTIWLEGVRRAQSRGALVLVARPAETEAGLSFAGLADLFGGVPAEVCAGLPLPQREALAAALLQVPTPAGGMDDRAVCASVLSLSRLLAEQRPVVVAVDDAQWLDPPTGRALGFAVRRLAREQIGFLVTVRTAGEPMPSFDQAAEPGRRQVVPVGPLTLAGLHQVIKQHAGYSLPRPTLVQVTRVCGGNPFYAIEMAAEMHRRPAGGGRVPVPVSVGGLVEGRLVRLPPATQRALLAAAALSQPTVQLVDRAALVPAEDEGLISVEQGRIRFAHPLFASAVYGRAGTQVRRRLHQRLATLVTDPEERARHLALGARPPDAVVAAELDAAAELAARRGASEAAAGLVELALGLSPPDDTAGQSRRLIAASRFWFNAGDLARAQTMLEQGVASTPAGPLRSHALQLLGEVHALRSSFSEAFGYAFQALEEADADPALRASAELNLTYCCINMVDFEGAQVHAQAATQAAELSGRAEVLADALAALTMAEFLGGRGLDEQRLARALALENLAWTGTGSFVMRPSLASGMLLLWTGEPDEALARLGAFRAQALARGEESALPVLTLFLVWACLWRGDTGGAAHFAGESLEAATVAGDAAATAVALGASALVHAHDGNYPLTRQQAAEALAIFHDLRWPSGTIWPQWALGLAELARGDPAAVDAVLGPLADMVTKAGTDVALAMFLPDEIEALIELGRTDQARTLTEWLQQRSTQQARPWALALAGRCRGLLHAADGDNQAALATLQQALAEHDRLGAMPFDRARTLLALGRVLRRSLKRARARAALTEALTGFQQTGAPTWAARAQDELDRLGTRAASTTLLTPTEARVAELAAAGLSNRQIAEQAFLTVKTVEANLTRVYRKLHIRSRAALARTLSQTGQPLTGR
ncbi:MAG TPA: AAA family ATPase [Streptosporangiaceae bacterium]|nr:AAA family ATPase [Streptosporangiaceae bacterium]